MNWACVTWDDGSALGDRFVGRLFRSSWLTHWPSVISLGKFVWWRSWLVSRLAALAAAATLSDEFSPPAMSWPRLTGINHVRNETRRPIGSAPCQRPPRGRSITWCGGPRGILCLWRDAVGDVSQIGAVMSVVS